jgi:hypothetical protein
MVHYLDYLGEKLPVRITFRVQESIQIETGIDVEDKEVVAKAGLTLLIPILYYALKAGFKADKKVFDIKREDEEYLRDILDECAADFLTNYENFIYVGKVVNRSSKKK